MLRRSEQEFCQCFGDLGLTGAGRSGKPATGRAAGESATRSQFATLGAGAPLAGSLASPHPATASRLEYALTQPSVICHYLRLAIWPHPLCFDYYWPAAKQLGEILLPGLAVAALVLWLL